MARGECQRRPAVPDCPAGIPVMVHLSPAHFRALEFLTRVSRASVSDVQLSRQASELLTNQIERGVMDVRKITVTELVERVGLTPARTVAP